MCLLLWLDSNSPPVEKDRWKYGSFYFGSFPDVFIVFAPNFLFWLCWIVPDCCWKPGVSQQFDVCVRTCAGRYPHELLSAMRTPSAIASWLRYTLRIPVYVLSAAIEGRSLTRAAPSVVGDHCGRLLLCPPRCDGIPGPALQSLLSAGGHAAVLGPEALAGPLSSR